MRVLVRGGGDLASGVILRLWRAGWQVLVTELPQPRAVRRTVSFAQAVFDGESRVEEAIARRVQAIEQVEAALSGGIVPVVVDPQSVLREVFTPQVLVDARMRKLPSELGRDAAPLTIGLGPGFVAGKDCHAVVETNRGPFLGRVFWQGSAQPDTGIPERVGAYQEERVLRAPQGGIFIPVTEIGQALRMGDIVGHVDGEPIHARFDGTLRGLLHYGLSVSEGEKIGDIDPRGDPDLCWWVSDKALSIGGGVLEGILSWQAGKSGR